MRRAAPRVALLVLAMAGLVAGVAAGLARLGVPGVSERLAAEHAALMIAGFLGTVIALERAVAFGGGRAFAAPAASALGTLALLAGWEPAALVLWGAAPWLLLAVSVALVRRQPLPHMVLLAVAALALACGNALYGGQRLEAAIPWWFTFLVLTIAAERLEMTRLMRRRPGANALFAVVVAGLIGGAALTGIAPRAGGIAFGAALVSLAGWLVAFDLARRTLGRPGFAGYAAAALLAGYGWLAVGGLAWAALSSGAWAMRDTALHALGLGFVMSMILGHAPLVVPAVAGLRMRFSLAFYLPLVLLHGSLLLRVAAPELRRAGGVLNALAIAAFAVVLAWSLRGNRLPTTIRTHV